MALELILPTVGTGANECARWDAAGAAGVGVGAASGADSGTTSGAASGAGNDGTLVSGAEDAAITNPAEDDTGVLPLARDRLLMLLLKLAWQIDINTRYY